MKLTRVGMILVLLALAGSPALGQAPGSQGRAPEPGDATKAPEKIVWEYFAAYLAWINYDSTRRNKEIKHEAAIPDKSLDPDYVTRHFIEAYKKLTAEDVRVRAENVRLGTGEIGFLSWDPIICGNGSPDDMANASVVLKEKSGNDAVVKVNLWGPKNVTPFTVNLKKQKEGGWRINAIICPGTKYNLK